MDSRTGLPVVGMVGGGQLARMTHQAAIALGQSLRVLAASPDDGAALVAADTMIGHHTDLDALLRFAKGCEVVTFDHEHVPGEHIRALTAAGVTVYPGADALRYAQDKRLMRARLAELGAPVPAWRPVTSIAGVEAFLAEYGPAVVKSTTGGYDGRGVWFLSTAADAEPLLDGGLELIIEERVELRRELSALVARSPFGQVAAYPVVETVQRNGICVEVVAPAPGLSEHQAVQAQQLAIRLATTLGVVGLLAVEMFERIDGTILVNELGWPLPLAGAATLAAVAAVAALVGFAAAGRTAGLYFAIVTFAFGELLVQVVNNTTSVSGGSEGLPVSFGMGSQMPFGWSVYRYFCLWIAIATLITLVVAALVRNTQFGLRLTAIRDSEHQVRGLGFDPTRYKTAIFVVASALAALLGVVYAPMVGFVNPSLMGVDQSIYILGLLFVGGIRSVRGAFLGVALLATVPQLLEMDPVIRPVVVGVAMAIIVLTAPGRGLVGLLDLLAARALGVRRRGGGPGSGPPGKGRARPAPVPAGGAATALAEGS